MTGAQMANPGERLRGATLPPSSLAPVTSAELSNKLHARLGFHIVQTGFVRLNQSVTVTTLVDCVKTFQGLKPRLCYLQRLQYTYHVAVMILNHSNTQTYFSGTLKKCFFNGMICVCESIQADFFTAEHVPVGPHRSMLGLLDPPQRLQACSF